MRLGYSMKCLKGDGIEKRRGETKILKWGHTGSRGRYLKNAGEGGKGG